MSKKFSLQFLLISLLFLMSGCREKEIVEGYTDEEMLSYLKDKYGIEVQIIDYEQEEKYNKEDDYYYYGKLWKVSTKEKPGLVFIVRNDLNRNYELVLMEEYPQRLFYYYLEQSDLQYSIEDEELEWEIDSYVHIYFKSRDDIHSCIKKTCDVIKRTAKDFSYHCKVSEDRTIVKGLAFVFQDDTGDYLSYSTCHGLALKKDTIADADTKYEMLRGDRSPYDEEPYNKPMGLNEISKAWEQMTGKDCEWYYHDKPYINEARTAALKVLKEKGNTIKQLRFGRTWSGLWDGNTIEFYWFQKEGVSHSEIEMEYVCQEWREKRIIVRER